MSDYTHKSLRDWAERTQEALSLLEGDLKATLNEIEDILETFPEGDESEEDISHKRAPNPVDVFEVDGVRYWTIYAYMLEFHENELPGENLVRGSAYHDQGKRVDPDQFCRDTQRDGFWLTNQCRKVNAPIVTVEAPAFLLERWTELAAEGGHNPHATTLNAYPEQWLAHRFERRAMKSRLA